MLGGLLGAGLRAATVARAADVVAEDLAPPDEALSQTTGERRARAAFDRLGLSGSIAFDYYSSNHDIDDREHFLGLNLVVKQRLKLAEDVRWV
ncbi:MAG: hypothetical protein ABIR79_11210, partial [Candidatus Binatia bacterium]